MSSLVLARKWRPHTFETVRGQTHAIQALTHALSSQRLHHAYLFTGTRGVGKTSIARILAKALSCAKGISASPCGECLNCQEIDAGRFADLIEIDAASRSKVEDTREILDNVLYAPVRGRFKIYLIDEIHMLSGHSFNALLKTLEEPPEHVKFLLATTDPKKLPVTVLSRCLQFHLKNMLPDEIIQHLSDILNKEQITYEEGALPWIARAADGSLRDALSLLDQAIAYSYQNHLIEKDVREMLGYVESTHIIRLIEAIVERNAKKILTISSQLQHEGADCFHVLQELINFFHQLTIIQCIAEYKENNKELISLASKILPEDLQLFYQIALKGTQDLSLAPTPWVALEMILLRMLTFQPANSENSFSILAEKENDAVRNEVKGLQPQKNSDLHSIAADASSVSFEKMSENKVYNSASALNASSLSPQNNVLKEPAAQKSFLLQSSGEWEKLLPSLNLVGMANTVAQHCVLESVSDTQIILHTPSKYETLLTASIKKQIENAVFEYFAKHQKVVKISFQMAEDKLSSPAVKKEEKNQEILQTTKTSFDNDQTFQKILNVFHGTIIPDSIKNSNLTN